MKYECETCGKAPLNDDEVYICPFSHLIYCKECFGELFGVCHECWDFYLLDDMVIHNDKFYCSDCFIDSFTTCDICRAVKDRNNDEIYYYESFDCWLCDDCYHENYFYCEKCDTDVSYDHSPMRTFDSMAVCETCHEVLLIENKGILGVLREFILFEQKQPFSEKTLRIWILPLLAGKFKCPCILANYSCEVSCPRKLPCCIANDLYSIISKTNRKFIRFYLLRKLLEIYSEVDNNEFLNSIGYNNLLELLKSAKDLHLFGY